MGRRKIEIRAIKDDRNRSVTFLKRKGGLFKKAHELSVLCSVDVAVIIFGHNKKLYEFSSGDIAETLRRYQYYGQAHEHKGPADFKGKGGGDDEDEDEDEEDMSNTREDSMPPQIQGIPPHLQHHNSFPHLRQQAASVSPPMPNGMFPRHATPQPAQMGSRPSSQNTIRRTSSNLIPLQHHPTPPPPQNGFAYTPNPPIYNPNAGPPPHPSPQPHYQQFPPLQQPQQQQQQPQPSHQQIQAAHQVYLQEQRRLSVPQNGLQPPSQQPPPRSSPQPEQQQNLRPPEAISPPQPKHLSSKSRSIFTPIDDGGSVLAQHFFGAPDPPQRLLKKENSPEIKPPPRNSTVPRSIPQPTRHQSQTSEFAPPSRSNTSGSKSGARPKLNLQIPSEASDNESTTGSPHQSGGGVSANPARSSDAHHTGIHLPPPSPSASAVLSAGASGPPNPFARPPPPTSSQNTNAYSENRNNVETPMSALPSRFIADNLLPSPGGFYDWDSFGRNGLNSAVLPSPLTFQTPVAGVGLGFGRGDTTEGVGGVGEKRKGSEDRERAGEAKKVKI